MNRAFSPLVIVILGFGYLAPALGEDDALYPPSNVSPMETHDALYPDSDPRPLDAQEDFDADLADPPSESFEDPEPNPEPEACLADDQDWEGTEFVSCKSPSSPIATTTGSNVPADCDIRKAGLKVYRCSSVHVYAGAFIHYTCADGRSGKFALPTVTYPGCCAGTACKGSDWNAFKACTSDYPKVCNSCKEKFSSTDKSVVAQFIPGWEAQLKAKGSATATTVDFSLTWLVNWGDPRPCDKWADDVIQQVIDTYPQSH